ncbi:DUF5686 and carboxypeptidase-like regulatory domain-containing protein [Mucilaginibacter sp. UR6-11]|uniref:DUF5686 and carboxypeptidase-like regulatory domain-containing protein n=1 Tax=Mucilaginibacter sp. UR6-11 TaxID=1435644 RepID=UPI001E626A64|nr:DUF5686 and carboxypeptidase-like regulatory domain-containing protein [Mucilaginibacter sp. UR6-11]MCC8426238.1 DUF5686 and carboxypeptidase regulatory-like domain-containing protein [Mucilaginibacter sp. UR6-11]
MDLKSLFRKFSFVAFLLFNTAALFAQTTHVTGVVTDGSTKNGEPMPFVTVGFAGSTIGAPTNNDGRFSISSDKIYKQIKASFIGYKDVFINIVPGISQVVNIKMMPAQTELTEVDVRAGKKPRYRNKGNPAVELIRQVIAHREQNRPEAYNYVEYKEYDKMQFSIANLSSKIAEKKFFRKYKFVLDNRDSTTVPGKSLLPIFLDEKISQYYYRKHPEKERTIILGQRNVDFGGSIDNEGVGQFFKYMYGKVDIYENSINLITNNFLSPIANGGPTFYKYFITDTIVTEDKKKLVELSFTPRNTQDMLFEGKIYITLDSNYAVQKAKLGINKNINLNFVKSMTVNLDFEKNPDGRYHLSKSNTLADFGVNKKKSGGFFGIRTLTYKNYVVNKPLADTAYVSGTQDIVVSDEVKHRSEQFWRQNRLDTLTTAESKVYKNIDSLSHMPSFKRTLDIATLLLAGYKSFNTFEIGPSNTFYSFNPIEGFKLRLGGRTTPELSKRYYFETYAAYGFKDEKWKGFLSATYSINDKSIYKFPQNYIRASFQRDTKIPGAALQFVQQDNFLLSFKRGVNDKYLYNDFYKFDYVHEYENHFSYNLTLKKWTQSPAGSLYFINNTGPINNLTTSEVSLNLRYAPDEQFYQGKIYRVPIPSKHPVLNFDYTKGFKGAFGGAYNYQTVHLRLDRRNYLSQLGYMDMVIEGGKTFGQVPYPLLTIFRANQTYAYDLYSYNLMNFLEFVSDRYASINLDQHFMGFFFNKIPLLQKLKLREVASFKAIYGQLSDQNNPALHPSLYQFPVTSTGQPITYSLGNTPYIEGSVGVENIFKFIRVDLVKRFNYLDHPDVSPLGVRVRLKFDF